MRLLWVIFLCFSPISQAQDLSHFFSEEEEGAFVLLDLVSGKCLVEYNPRLCETRLSPCSTFKVPNALIGLDLEILKDENTLFSWDGSPQMFTAWEKDHTLASAIRFSAIWYFQKLAEKIGERNYHQYLERFAYGNRDITSGLTQFWLGKSLLISPHEQVEFLIKLYKDKLPIAAQAMQIVKKILVLENTPVWILSGKTGTNVELHLGWFVGHVSIDNREYVFATCMRGGTSSGPRAKTVTRQILQEVLLEKNSE